MIIICKVEIGIITGIYVDIDSGIIMLDIYKY